MAANPYEQYKKQSILTMTQGEIVVRLFDECLKMLNFGIQYIKLKDYESVNTSLQKAQRILNYLKASLDMKYEISENLASLYEYYIKRIVTANIKKDIEPLNEVIPMITDIRNSFNEAEKIIHTKN